MTLPVLYPIHQLHKDCDLRQLTHPSRATCLHLSLPPFPFSLPLHPSNLFLLHIAIYAKSLFFGLSHSLVLTTSASPSRPCPHILHPSLAPHSTTSFSASHIHCHDPYLLLSSPDLLFAQKTVPFPSLPSLSHTKCC